VPVRAGIDLPTQWGLTASAAPQNSSTAAAGRNYGISVARRPLDVQVVTIRPGTLPAS
jgi:hypothetical protein